MSRALGRYELLRPLARGGMGEVYLARRRAAGVEKWLVVKRMRPERSGDTRFLDLFMREAKLSMSLAHQNIVPVFDFGRIGDQVFLAMERVEGKDLGSSLQKAAKPLPPLIAAFIAAECLQALDYAHRRKGTDGNPLGIVHRDVTPRNVLLSWSGEVKLTDFGIAALATDVTSRTAGTPAYMAPEQARGEPLDQRADIYALGLVLYEALVGQRARRSNDRDTVIELAKNGQLEPWPDGLDTPLRAVVEKATDLDKTKRYADAREMLEDIDAFMVGARAANRGDAPARQLATWLTDVWADTREDEGAIDAQIDAGVMVSFLDDGPLDVVGTGTERSALATVAESTGQKPFTESAVTSAAGKSSVPPAVSDIAISPDAAVRAPKATEAAVVATRASSTRRRIVLLVIGAAIAAGAIALLAKRGDDSSRGTAPPDGGATALAAPDAATQLIAEAPADAASVPMTADAAITSSEAPIDAGVARIRVRPHSPVLSDAGAGSASAVIVEKPTAKGRKVTINSKPWSNWSVDGGAQHSGLETIELAPGTHVIHFTGNPYFKADRKVTITVPDKDGFTHVETLEADAP